MDHAIFDPALLKEWEQVDPDNWRSMVGELIDLFFKSAEVKYEELQVAWTQKDWKKMSDSAHALKSSCGNVGAVEAQRILNEIEQLAQKKDAVAITHRMKELSEVFKRSLDAVIDFKKSILKPPENLS